jgi:surface protein
MVMLDTTAVNIDIQAGGDYLTIRYTSEDSITFTKEEGVESYEFPVPISCAYPEEWIDEVGYFLQIGDVNFEGIFNYSKNKWEYSKVGLSTTPDYVYANKKVYTNSGTIEGSLTKNLAENYSDTNAKILGEILIGYKDFEKEVVGEDGSSYFNGKDFYIIPTDLNGNSIVDTSQTTDAEQMFRACGNLIIGPNIDTSNVTNMCSMFQFCNNLRAVPKYNTSKVTAMVGMFENCSKLETIPQFDTSNVTKIGRMFQYCSSLKSIPLLNTSKVDDMWDTFSCCSSLEEIPLLDTSNVLEMNRAFQSCAKLKSIPLFDTSKVTSFYGTFSSCASLETFPALNTSSATNFDDMFSHCESLKSVPLLDTSNATILAGMFRGCKSLTSIPAFSTSKAKSWMGFCNGCTSLVDVPVLSMVSADISSLQYLFQGCPNLSDQSLENIMQSCISAGNLTYSKDASFIGLTAEQGERLKTLPSYSAWIAKGWTV